ncbi:MAG: hypothetical protein KGI07_05370 [Thaumarchaeota archaeon]|nr:hypothetical protein [Nitrososphaerota archaeon]
MTKVHFRSWFYFQTGYSQYFTFSIAIVNMLTTTYYLIISQNSEIGKIFPNFSIYVLVSSIIAVPILITLGFIHMRRSAIYTSQQDVLQESWPYNYYLTPGIQKEILAPLLRELLELGRHSISNDGITSEQSRRLDELVTKLELLISGGSLEMPKKFGRV